MLNESNGLRIADVALLTASVPTPLSYRVPDELRKRVAIGLAVAVPLQNRITSGIVVGSRELGVGNRETGGHALRAIHSLLDDRPVLNAKQLELARWIAQEYYAPLGRCCALMTPPGFTPQSSYVYSLADDRQPSTNNQQPTTNNQIIALLARRGPLTEAKLKSELKGVKAWRAALKRLVTRGVIERTSTLQPPKVQPQRTTLVQLVISDATLEVVRENLRTGKHRLQPQTRERRAAALEYLHDRNGLAWADWIKAETGATRTDLAWLSDQGYVLLGDAERWRDPLADIDYVVKSPPPLTDDQQRAWNAIELRMKNEELRNDEFSILNSQFSILNSQFLIRGVTGSGKTEIYMRAVAEALRQGRGAIVLVPEISLTPQTARRFLERFPGKVALIHSGLKPGERFDTWRRIRAGDLPIVVGARSALFAPLPDVGLIVLDEEHDSSYKQGAPPFYDARRVATKYAELCHATLIMGSATPSLEAMWSVNRESWIHDSRSTIHDPRFTLLELPNRVRGHVNRIADQQARFGLRAAAEKETETVAYQSLPNVQVIDMRAELRGGNTSMFSGALFRALGETLQRGEQAILFLNRRGAASCVVCRDCGHAMRCPNDDMPLTYHDDRRRTIDDSKQSPIANRKSQILKCHHCNHTEPAPTICPVCRSSRIRFIGIGTQKIEHAILEHFPQARAVRWDKDSASGHAGADQMLQRFVNQQADVLIGTQMIAKGIDLPLVTLVGVVLADVGLFLPDFRASERVFDLIEQVSGRAGRGLLPGKVIVQTYNPDHPAIAFAARHDVAGFARYELAQRKMLNLPPFTRLVRFEAIHPKQDEARQACEMLARQVRRRVVQPSDVIGPAQAYFARKNKRHRWQLLVRTSSPSDLLHGLEAPRGVLVDVDPINVL